MSTMSMSQIAGYAHAAGFRGNSLVIATAVAMAESSGRAAVVNSIGCVGLWQINQPVHVIAHPTWSRAWLVNPLNNARAAFEISGGGTNWRPWEVFTNGMYLRHMHAAERAVNENSLAFGTADFVQNEIRPTFNFVASLFDPNFWKRVMIVIVGVALVLYSLWQMADAPTVPIIGRVLGK